MKKLVKHFKFILLFLFVPVVDLVQFYVENNSAVFQIYDFDTSINGKYRDSNNENIIIDLNCGINQIIIQHKETLESYKEIINNCQIETLHLKGLIEDLLIKDLKDIDEMEDVELQIAVKYQKCGYVDECDSHLWWIQKKESEIAYLNNNEKCASGTIEKSDNGIICTRKKPSITNNYVIVSKIDRSFYNGKLIKGNEMENYAISTESINIRRKREDETVSICDYTILSTTTSMPTTTTVTTTEITTTTTTTVTTTQPITTTIPEDTICNYLFEDTTTILTTTSIPTTTMLSTSVNTITSEKDSTSMITTSKQYTTSIESTLTTTTSDLSSTTQIESKGTSSISTEAILTTKGRSDSSTEKSTTSDSSSIAETEGTASEKISTTTSESTSTKGTTTIQSFDFYLTDLTWNETREYYNDFLFLDPVSVSGSIINTSSYECRSSSSEEFIVAKNSTCFQSNSTEMRLYTFTASVNLTIVNTFKSPGTYEIRINSTELYTSLNASHILSLYLLGSTTTTQSTKLTTTSEIRTSDLSSMGTSTTIPTSQESAESTANAEVTTSSFYDFVLDNLTWNETIYLSNSSFNITPVPNKNTDMKNISYECRNDSTNVFELAKNSLCFNFETSAMKALTFTSNLYFSPVSTAFVGIGTYELRINMTNLVTFQSASHILTIYVLDITTTLKVSTTTSKKDSTTISTTTSTRTNAGSSRKLTTTTTTVMDSTTTSEYDFTLNGSLWNVTIYYSDDTFTIEPVPNKDQEYRNISYECRNDSSLQFVSAKEAENCFKFETSAMKSLTFTTPIEISPVSAGFVGLGTYEIRINLTNLITLQKASHILTVNVVSQKTSTSEITFSTSPGIDSTTKKSTKFPTSSNSETDSTSTTSTKPTTITTKSLGWISTLSSLSDEESNTIEEWSDGINAKINDIIENANSSTKLNTSSSLINELSELSAEELQEVASSLISGDLEISTSDNLTTAEILEALEENIANSNSALADDLQDVIQELADTNMTSATTMNSVLSSLELALQGSTVYTLGTTSSDSIEGSHSVVYGYIHADGYDVITPRSTMSIYGSTVYVTGDTRASYLQQEGDSVTIGTLSSEVGITAQFLTNGRTVLSEESEVVEEDDLISDQLMSTMEGESSIEATDYSYSTLYATVWNVSYTSPGIEDTSQVNSSISFWLPVNSVEYSLSIESGTILKLQGTKTTSSIGLKVVVEYGSITYNIELGSGNGRFIKVSSESCIFSYDASDLEIEASDGSDVSGFQSMIQLPIVIENIDASIFDDSSATSPLTFSGYNGNPLRIIISPEDTDLPEISSIAENVAISIFEPTTTYSSETDLKTAISDEEDITVSGTLLFENRSSIEISSYSFWKDSNAIYFKKGEKLIIISSATYEIVSLSLGGYGIEITEGSYTTGAQQHSVTFMEFSDTEKLRIDGGIIIRNGSNGYVIENGEVSTEGDISGTEVEISSQSLLTQESQELIVTILNNTSNYLEENGMTMTEEELNETSTSLLSIASSLTSALETALDNPLSSDLEECLQYATDNYDDLYNVLTTDSDDIVYVEEMSSEEWAEYVTELFQKNIAKKVANQLESTLDTLEDTLAARAIAAGNLPYSYWNEADGTGIAIEIDTASNLVGVAHTCNDWTVILPSPASSLNNSEIDDDTYIQLGLICYDTNPRLYVDNFDLLITSGALEAHIKDLEQNVLEVNDSKKSISVRGRAVEDDALSTSMQSGEFESYQVLDIHTFRTTNWNNSIQFEIMATEDYIIPEDDDTYVFASFQSLPGPYEQDHQWMFRLNQLNSSSTYFIDASGLVNSTGLFYIGIGKRDNSTNSSEVVSYGEYDGKTWSFQKDFDMDYTVSSISKGCYFYNSTTDEFNSKGMYPLNETGMQFVNCSTNHMTLFSIGSFNPTTDADFDYSYVVMTIPKNIRVLCVCIFVYALFGTMMLINMITERKDPSKGQLRFLADNEPLDGYIYIITVETGYRMFATTDSSLNFNISGTEGDQIFRSFKCNSEWEYPFTWGTGSRFVMTTAYPLGDLEYMRVWLEDAGLEHRESWYCNQIIVKDLQTQKIYHFPFHNWLGTKNGDGETERLSRVDNRKRILDESMSMHMLGQTIFWFAAFTAGNNRVRTRCCRYEYTNAICFSITLCALLNVIICNFDNSSDSKTSLSDFSFSIKDLILGFVFGILITIFSLIHVLICQKSRSKEEQRCYNNFKKIEKDFKDPGKSWPNFCGFLSRSICLSFILLAPFAIITIGLDLIDDSVSSFYIRFLVSFISWVILFEPIKGIIMAFIIIKTNQNYKISNPLEETFLRVKPVDTFKKNPYGRIEKEIGTDIADVTKLRDTENRKMRDEQLFITLRDMICFFSSLYIMVSLTYYCRDRHGYYYQEQMSNLLNISQSTYGDASFMSIRNRDEFWNWARDSLAVALKASWYDGNAAYDMRAYLNDKVSRSMGSGTIRQVRTKKNSNCEILKQFEPYISHCGEELTSGNEETALYMQAGWTELEENSTDSAAEEYTYKTSESLMNGVISGFVNSYGGGGYTISLSGTVSEMKSSFTTLQNENWIDDYTRAIMIEFSQYNAQINYFSVVQLLIEIPKSGIYLPNAWVESVRLIKSEGTDGTIVKYYEVIYIIFSIIIFLKEIVYYIHGRYEVIKSLKGVRNPIKYTFYLIFKNFSPWNFMDLIVGILAVASVIAYYLREIYTDQAMEDFNENNGNSYMNLSKQRNTEIAFSICLAGAVFFTSCKMIRILKFNRRIGVLAATLDNALGAIAAFGFAFLIFCLAFDSILYVILGNKLSGYRSLISSLQTSLAGMLGKLDVVSIQPISQFASIAHIIFIMLGSKLLLQLYVTIIMYEFEQIRNDSDKQTNDYEIIEHIRYKTKHRLGLLQPKDSAPVSVPDTQKDFQLFNVALAQANLLEHRINRILQEEKQTKNMDFLKYNVRFDATEAIEGKKFSQFEKWRLTDLKMK